MELYSKTASPGRLTVPVVSKAVAASNYYHPSEISTPESYATAKIQSRFRLKIETARTIAHLSAMGGFAR